MSDASTRSYILLSVTMETTWGCAKLQLVNRSLRAQAYLSTSTKMTGAYRNNSPPPHGTSRTEFTAKQH